MPACCPVGVQREAEQVGRRGERRVRVPSRSHVADEVRHHAVERQVGHVDALRAELAEVVAARRRADRVVDHGAGGAEDARAEAVRRRGLQRGRGAADSTVGEAHERDRRDVVLPARRAPGGGRCDLDDRRSHQPPQLVVRMAARVQVDAAALRDPPRPVGLRALQLAEDEVRLDAEHVAEVAAIARRHDRLDHRMPAQDHVHLAEHARRLDRRQHPVEALRAQGRRLLQQHVAAGPGGLDGLALVEVARRRDHHGLHAVVRQRVFEPGVHGAVEAQLACRALGAMAVDVDDRLYARTARVPRRPQVLEAGVAGADDGDPDAHASPSTTSNRQIAVPSGSRMYVVFERTPPST